MDNIVKTNLEWLYNMVGNGYKIVAAYSLVNFCALVKRNKDRTNNSP